MEKLYSTHAIAEMIQVDPSSVSKWIDKSFLLAFRTPGGHRRVRASDLRSFLVAHQMPVPEALGSDAVRLLIVDDEQPVLDSLKRAFKPYAAQLQVSTTTSGVEAVLQIAETRPHGVLIDLGMPDVDGLELCRRIRDRRGLDSVTLVTMTGHLTPEKSRESLKGGAAACLSKPIDVAVVLTLFKVPMAFARAG